MMGGYQIVQNTVSSVYILSLKDEDTKEAGEVYRQEVVLISVTERRRELLPWLSFTI